MPQRDLGGAVGADLGKAIELAVSDRDAVVASTEGPVPDRAAVTPSLGGCDMPDVLVFALQAERVLRAKLFCHAGESSLGRGRQPRGQGTGQPRVGSTPTSGTAILSTNRG
jgi:hypothetical protein